MGKNLGTSATLFTLIAAFLFHVNGTGSLEKPSQSAEQNRNSTAAMQDSGSSNTSQETELDEASQGFSPKDLGSCPSTAGCQDRLQDDLGFKDCKLQFLVVSVPDPERTRLSLFTDTAINAVQQAAFDAHWELATQWLPWHVQSASHGRSAGPVVRVRRKDQPGWLIFRHSPTNNEFDNKVLVMFVVGETPTAGLNAEQFRTARAYMRALGDPPSVRLVMPCFSGSIFSLTKLIEGDRKLSASHPHKYSIRSGSATDRILVSTFHGAKDVDVFGTNLDNEDGESKFLQVLQSLRIPPNESALLVEDESAYSKNVSDVSISKDPNREKNPLILRYPRDISNLRNHYREINETTHTGKTPQDVDFSLQDLDTGDDSLPIFSNEKTPVEQDAILNEITAQIRRDSIRLIRISATNVLDLIFLTRVLRLQCPDTRALVTSPDLLFIKESQEFSLEGTLALSTYPLFFSASHWIDKHRMVHPNANEEGLYYAAKLLLLSPDQGESFNGYTWKNQPFPASWLMSLGHHGFTPIRLMQNANKGPNGSEEDWFEEGKPTEESTFVLPHPPSSWTLLLSLLSLTSLATCSWIVYLSRNIRVATLDIVAPDSTHIADAHRLICLLCVLLLLATMQGVLLIPLGLSCFSLSHLFPIFCAILPVVLSCWLVRKILNKPRCGPTRYLVLGICFLLPSLVLVQWARCCYRSLDHIGFFFSFRALEMQTGSSPVLPILFLLAALLTFAAGHLIRFYYAISHRPRMFVAAMDQFFSFKMRNCRRDLNRVLVAPMNLSPRRQGYLVGVVLLAVTLLLTVWRAGRKLSSIEGLGYDLLVLGLVCAVTLVLLMTALQLKLAWAALQPILTRLNALPLRSAFSLISDAGNGGPIWAKRLNMQSLAVPVRSLTLLHDLQVLALNDTWSYEITYKSINQSRGHYSGVLSGLLENGQTYARKKLSRHAKRNLFGSLRYLGAMLSHTIAQRVLVPEWQKRILSSEGHNLLDESKSNVVSADAYQLSQTFVALQLSAFINYAVRQIQNLAFILSLAFGLLVLALNLYPAQAPQATNRLLLICFVVLGYFIWTVLSQMERDPVLSQLSGTTEGVLNKEFYFKILAYGAVPVLTLLTSQFPAIGSFVSSWLQPSLEALR